ncbi:hypothetical protein MSIBF_A1170004 [groundwater metagenome]|uniref:HEPN domain-containing protein n=1 Tax=groundwater metagenome TaxID=717931 RepID=A0A098E822_9ZZZZ
MKNRKLLRQITKFKDKMEIKNNNSDIAKKYLEIAEKDLEVSKLLYDNGYYSSSIYYLQQSVEKLMKYYFLKMGMKPEGLKHYLGHEPIDKHVLKGILMFFKGYTFSNIIITYIGMSIMYYIIEKGKFNIPFNHNQEDIFMSKEKLVEFWGRTILTALKNENSDYELEDELKKSLPNLTKNQKLIYEPLEEFMNLDGHAILKMKKEDILHYAFGLTEFFSNKNLPEYIGLYAKMLEFVENMKKNEKIRKYLDIYFLEVYGTNMEEYFNDCNYEIQKDGRKPLYKCSLDLKYKQQLNEKNIGSEFKNEIKKNIKHTFHNEKVSKIDEKHWEIVDNKIALRIRDAGKQLHLYKKIKSIDADIKNVFENVEEDIKLNLANRNTCPIVIIILSMITGPHVSCTRYPDEILKPIDYTDFPHITLKNDKIYKFFV